MKCSRNAENKVRKVVGIILSLILLAAYVTVWVYVPMPVLGAHAIIIFVVTGLFLTSWLAGEIDFCNNDE